MPPDDATARIESKIDRVIECLQGSLEDGTPGLVSRVDSLEKSRPADLMVRMDRLEQRDQNRTWWMRAAGAAGLSGLVASVVALLKGHA